MEDMYTTGNYALTGCDRLSLTAVRMHAYVSPKMDPSSRRPPDLAVALGGRFAVDMSGYRVFGKISMPSHPSHRADKSPRRWRNMSHPLQSPEGQKVLKRGASEYKRHIERGIGLPQHKRFAARLVALVANSHLQGSRLCLHGPACCSRTRL